MTLRRLLLVAGGGRAATAPEDEDMAFRGVYLDDNGGGDHFHVGGSPHFDPPWSHALTTWFSIEFRGTLG